MAKKIKKSQKNAIFFAIAWIIGVSFIALSFGDVAILGYDTPQPFTGFGDRITESVEGITQTLSFRRLTNLISNPFDIRPERGDYEESPDDPVRPDQAFNVEIRGTESVMLDQKGLITFVRVNNVGSTRIGKVEVDVNLRGVFSGCVRYEDYSVDLNETEEKDMEYWTNKVNLSNISPGSSREYSLSRGQLRPDCMLSRIARESFTANQPIGNVELFARAETMYPAASRLAVERIERNYGELLIGSNVLKQESRGAVYRAGSAVVIDMDIGYQPILVEKDEEDASAGLIMSYVNIGRGTIVGEPNLLIVTPKDFGECEPPGLEVTCSDDDEWNDKIEDLMIDSEIYAPHITEILEWVDESTEGENRENNACLIQEDIKDFELITCSLDIPEIGDEQRATDYITAFALYNYRMDSRPITIRTWCTDVDKSWCSE